MSLLDVKSLVSNLRSRRQILYAPSIDIKKLQKASIIEGLDTAAFDLEDGVTPQNKAIARENIVKYLKTEPTIKPEFAVRINSMNSSNGMLDLNQVILDPAVGKRLQCLIMPKVEDVDELKFADRWLHLNGLDHVRILAMIETPLGLTHVNEFCTATNKLDGLIFGAEDFRSAAGIAHAAGEMAILYARSAVVTAARAHNLQAIDMTSLDFRRAENCIKDAIGTRQLGFTGKQVIHPMQIECVNKAYTPDEKEKEQCSKMIATFVKNYLVDGKGVVDNEGVMVELPHIQDAIRRLILSGQTVDQVQEFVNRCANLK
ncbi:citrate lyase beta like protein [Tritrichomonas foetus]|uniref:Citrate lyase beta like protein n=1 Tax=Tritrichomonas foetus TaxID=1144522 RepID=A0A1J4J935_9EUKA|nr:citrate lyase beta like protein [Tritrichomonas foetus]|eukprot:OHS95698.1 citrate lyase beta like protein [Tritrichomonas foetus]